MLAKHLFSITTGPTLNKSLSEYPAGDICVLQMKDVSVNDFTIKSSSQKISDAGFLSHHYLMKNDILFLRAGSSNYAFYYDGRFPKAVASSMFFVMRPTRNDFLSEYVAYYLNQHKAQSLLHPVKAGTSVTNVTKSVLEEIEIPLPVIEQQQQIVKIHKQFFLEKAISENIIRQKSILLNSIMSKPVKDKPMIIQPDDLALWDKYLQVTHLINVKLKSPIMLVGKTDPVTSFIGAIVHYDQHQKSYTSNGITYGYPAIKEWRIVEKFDLFKYNNDTLPLDRPKLENVIPHTQIESMEFVPLVVNI